MPANCSSCSAPIIWRTTAANGKPIPIDAEPIADGNVVIREGLAVVIDSKFSPAVAGEVRWKAHWASCPTSATHRKPKPAAPDRVIGEDDDAQTDLWGRPLP